MYNMLKNKVVKTIYALCFRCSVSGGAECRSVSADEDRLEERAQSMLEENRVH